MPIRLLPIYHVLLGGGFRYFLYFHPYLGKWSNFTNIFQKGWFNHQLDVLPWKYCSWKFQVFLGGIIPVKPILPSKLEGIWSLKVTGEMTLPTASFWAPTDLVAFWKGNGTTLAISGKSRLVKYHFIWPDDWGIILLPEQGTFNQMFAMVGDPKERLYCWLVSFWAWTRSINHCASWKEWRTPFQQIRVSCSIYLGGISSDITKYSCGHVWHFVILIWVKNPYYIYTYHTYIGHIRARLSFERLPIHVHFVQNMCRQIDEILITLPRNFVHLVEKPTDLQLMNEVWHAVGLWLWDGLNGFDDLPILGKSGKLCSCLDGWLFLSFPCKRCVMDFLWT